jgi:hypothetical protein
MPAPKSPQFRQRAVELARLREKPIDQIAHATETYWNKSDCLGGVNLIKGNAAGARVVDNT